MRKLVVSLIGSSLGFTIIIICLINTARNNNSSSIILKEEPCKVDHSKEICFNLLFKNNAHEKIFLRTNKDRTKFYPHSFVYFKEKGGEKILEGGSRWDITSLNVLGILPGEAKDFFFSLENIPNNDSLIFFFHLYSDSLTMDEMTIGVNCHYNSQNKIVSDSYFFLE